MKMLLFTNEIEEEKKTHHLSHLIQYIEREKKKLELPQHTRIYIQRS